MDETIEEDIQVEENEEIISTEPIEENKEEENEAMENEDVDAKEESNKNDTNDSNETLESIIKKESGSELNIEPLEGESIKLMM